MRSFEIFVESEVPETRSNQPAPPPREIPRHSPGAPGRRPAKASDVLDLFVHGANVTARVAERHASCVLRDLAWALADLAREGTGKRIVHFYEDAWELCVERTGADASISVYRGGAEPTVLVYDRPVVFAEMIESVIDAIDGALRRSKDSAPILADLGEVRRALELARTIEVDVSAVGAIQSVSVDIDRDAPIGFSADFAMRTRVVPATNGNEPSVERADLHALLVRGRMRAEVRGRTLDLGEAFPFLFAERVLDLSRRALDAWERGQPFFARVDAAGIMIGLRAVAAEGAPPASLTLTPAAGALNAPSVATFPELSLFDVVEAVLAFGRGLVRAIIRRDRTQGANLRLGAFRRDLRALGDALREVRRQDSRINPAPESYRAFAQNVRARSPESSNAPGFGTRLRYTQRWRALVPNIDLKSTFLCGDRLVIGGALETFCLARTPGELLWRKTTPRAASVVTPAGLARITNDGGIALHDWSSGEVALRTWIAPRTSGPCAGTVVSTSGLPRLLIVTEGERHLVALDLTNGEARWRYTWGRAAGASAALRLKRSGKLLYVASGDSALTAVDVQTGAVVWRVRDRLRFHASPAVDNDALFAIAGGAASAASLHAIDPYSGRVAWTARLPASPCTVEGPPLLAGGTVTVAVRDRRGLRLAAFDRASGAPVFLTEPIAPIGTSWLAVDDLLVGNTPASEVLAIDTARGTVRWRHTLGRSNDSDVPRKLEPVLRSGALFVPHVDVHVFRPSDGTHLAQIGPCDAIPDLLRVDERCDVYVAEESGHMVAFGAGPRLSLVK
jgi:outer membrane protein assembly factor BamB